MSGTDPMGPSMAANALTISVVMPVYNGAHYLTRSVPPLVAMAQRNEILEVIVADDSSTDGSVKLAAELGATVLSTAGRLGPAGARNVAVRRTAGNILWFVDADVVAHEDGPWRLRAGLSDPATVAVFGSYDDKPPAGNFGSQYKNLVHHYYHQMSRPEASTFWAGYGAVRRDAFLAVGGFDAAGYRAPSIEDIELGYRLGRTGGRLLFDRDLLATHLKRWTLAQIVHTDVRRRAIPWARLMLARTGMINDLNVSKAERLRAGLAMGLAAGTMAWATGIIQGHTLLIAAMATLPANWRLFEFFRRRRGLWFAVRALAFHQIYYCYSATCFVYCWLEAKAVFGWLSKR